jgi:multisubunit Na+/H+ antiporter MnhG subunit
MESKPPENAQKMSLPRFLLALLIKPRRAFAQLDQTGKPHFLWAAAAMLVVIWLAAIVTLPVTQREAAEGYDKVMEQTTGKMSDQQTAMMEQQREFSTSPVFLVAGTGIMETIVYPVLWLAAAGVLYLLSLAFGGQVRFGAILSMTVWASIAEIVGKLFVMIGTLGLGRTPQPGLSYLVAADDIASLSPVSAALSAVLSKVTLFDIWYLVLIGIGVVVCAKVTRWKGAAITILYWLISLILPVAMAAIGAAVSSSFFG